MPISTSHAFLVPKNWDDFENLWWDILRDEWQDPNICRYGRQGQSQEGVDIYGQRPGVSGIVGVQCKLHGTDARLTTTEIDKCVVLADTFEPTLAEYIVVTTGPRDAKVQKHVRKLNAKRKSEGKFEVRVRFWEDAELRLGLNLEIAKRHFPQFFHESPVDPLSASYPPFESDQDLGSRTITWFVCSRMTPSLNVDRKAVVAAIENTEVAAAWHWERDGFIDGDDYEITCRHHVSRSDGLVLLVGRDLSPAVLSEYQAAREASIKCMVMVKEHGRRSSGAKEFINSEAPSATVRNYQNTSELRSHVIQALRHEITLRWRKSGTHLLSSVGSDVATSVGVDL